MLGACMSKDDTKHCTPDKNFFAENFFYFFARSTEHFFTVSREAHEVFTFSREAQKNIYFFERSAFLLFRAKRGDNLYML